ncbi:uncharacterized protein LOC127770929 [Oryza glaberrima]|uniref:uncharacterized protein LOC127770929 n=1 Tax=Oryza glaberrima TaxID=4538 RepID=UPI00224C467F|nr:uncharacterized protein LOC127770929 [Oryza glaberrima]
MEIWSTVGSTAIGWLVQNILGSLIGDKLKSWLRQMSLDDDTKKLESEMKNISATLEVAKGHKINNEQPALARCLRDLKDLLYDAEDVMDELDYYRLQDETIREANHSALRSLEYLYIQKCGITGKWLSLMLQHALALQELNLNDCKQITGLSIGEEENSQLNLMSSTEDPSLGYPGQDKLLRLPLNLIPSLKMVVIKCFDDLTFYGRKEDFAGFTSLEELHIRECSKLLSFLAHNDGNDEQSNGRWFLPLSLRELHIGYVDSPKKLQPCFPGNLTRLKKLEVYGNQSLTSLQLHSCTALQELIIQSCESLNYLEGLQLLGNLRLLRAHRCLSGHGEDGRCILPQSLEELYIRLHSLPSLKWLWISSCKNIARLPEMGLPPSLEKLYIDDCSEELVQEVQLCRTLASELKVRIDERYVN